MESLSFCVVYCPCLVFLCHRQYYVCGTEHSKLDACYCGQGSIWQQLCHPQPKEQVFTPLPEFVPDQFAVASCQRLQTCLAKPKKNKNRMNHWLCMHQLRSRLECVEALKIRIWVQLCRCSRHRSAKMGCPVPKVDKFPSSPTV